jgi:hypothetical protein
LARIVVRVGGVIVERRGSGVDQGQVAAGEPGKVDQEVGPFGRRQREPVALQRHRRTE